MQATNQDSLGSTVDALADALFFQTRISATHLVASVRGIASRRGLPGSYAGMFAPTPRDAAGFRLFTGELVRSRAGIGHLLGEEAMRVLAALPRRDRATQTALDRAVAGMAARLDELERHGCLPGTYCCGTCTAGYWRNLANGLLPHAAARLSSGLAQLRQHRLGDGTWRRYPFFYTSLALTEIGPALAGDELHYVAARWRQLLPRLERAKNPIARRRAAVGHRLLELCNQ